VDLPYELIDLEDVYLQVHGKAEVGLLAEVYGQASFGELITPSAVVYNTDNMDAVLEANSISGNSVTRLLTVTETLTEEVESETGEVEIVETEIEINQDISISRPVAEAAQSSQKPLLSDGVYIGKDGIVAGTIAEGTQIQIAADCGSGVAATKIKGSELQIGSNVIMTNMSYVDDDGDDDGDGKLDYVRIDPNAGEGVISSSGTLKTDVLNLPEGYALGTNKLIVNGSSIDEETGETTQYEYAVSSANLTTTGYTEFKGLAMKGADIVFESLNTDRLDIAEGSMVIAEAISTTEGAKVGANSTLIGAEVKGDLYVDVNSKLSNLTTYGVLSVGDKTTLSNSVIGNTLKNQGTATLKNVSLGKVTFGGEEGTSFSATGDCNSMIVSGTLTGSSLTVSDMTLDAMNLAFDDEPVTYTLLSVADGNSITLGDVDGFEIYVQSYTYAGIEVNEDGSVVITGSRNEAAAKSALMDTEARANAMAALEYAKEMAPDEVVETLYNTMGDVMHTSLEKRQELLDAISGASLTALADSQRRGIMDVQSSLRNRIIQMGGVREDESAGIQAWGQADGSFTSSDSGDDGPGYDYNTWGATVGANVDVCESVVVGMSFSAAYGELDVDSADSATGTNDAYYVNFFARHQSERWYRCSF
jgi:heat shock protein HslJ